jgi:hypothetical protein
MSIKNYRDIPGWGMDADPENEPTYPMKNYTGDDHKRIHYERSEQQPADVEVLHSNERPRLTAVFGTTVPPSGLSGVIKRYAFQHSEDRYRHWLPLILSDRINVFEGLIDDIKDGRFPNIIAERGLKVEWKYNRLAVVKKLLVGAVVAAVVWSSINKKRT